MKMKTALMGTMLILLCSGSTAYAQAPSPSPGPTPVPQKECDAESYKGSEVDRKVKILDYPHPNFSERQMEKYRGSLIVLRGLLCGSGKVTNLKVVRGVAPDVDEEAMRTARRIKFRPAQKNGQNVSQWMQFEYQLTWMRP